MRRITIYLTCIAFLFIGCGKAHAATDQAELDADLATLRSDMVTLDQAVSGLNMDQAFVSVGVSSATTGGTAMLLVNFIPGPKPITGLQASIVVGSSITVSNIAAGPMAIAAGKSVTANGDNFIVFGLNQLAIHEGVLATISLSLPATLKKGFYTVALLNPVATDANGNLVLMNTVSGTVRIGL